MEITSAPTSSLTTRAQWVSCDNQRSSFNPEVGYERADQLQGLQQHRREHHTQFGFGNFVESRSITSICIAEFEPLLTRCRRRALRAIPDFQAASSFRLRLILCPTDIKLHHRGSKSTGLALPVVERKISRTANRRIQFPMRPPQLLTEGLLVRI